MYLLLQLYHKLIRINRNLPLYLNSITPFINFSLNTVLKIDTKAPSLTPTEPGDGIPETVAYTIDCKHNIFM